MVLVRLACDSNCCNISLSSSSCAPARLFQRQSYKNYLGMTYKEVETGMGKPTRTVKEDAYWYDEDGEFFVSFGGVAGTVDQKQYYSRQILFVARFRQLSDLFLD